MWEFKICVLLWVWEDVECGFGYVDFDGGVIVKVCGVIDDEVCFVEVYDMVLEIVGIVYL